MAWIEVHQSLPTHRKTMSVGHLLDIPRTSVMGHMLSLWMWGVDNAPDGELKNLPHTVIADAAEWSKVERARLLTSKISRSRHSRMETSRPS